MKKTILAGLITAATFSAQVYAVELYNNNGSTFSFGGHVSMGVGNEDQNKDPYIRDDSLVVQSISPRLNFNATRQLGGGFKADAKGEWGLNTLNGGDTSFTTRLGYVGVSHDRWGRLVGGTQWSPYYDVAGVADMPIAFANDYLYDYKLGTARAEQMASYRKSFEFDALDFNLGVGWQGDNDEYGDRGQIALSIEVDSFFIGYAFTDGSVDAADDARGNLVSARYGSYGDGLFVAVVYESGQDLRPDPNTKDIISESDALEAIVAFALPNSVNFMINYEWVEDTDLNKTAYNEMALQVEYDFTKAFRGYIAYQFDLGDDESSDDDKYALGVRYYL